MSLTRFLVRGQSPRQFGATLGKQWPQVAIRRFMLYDVLLHELGHLQVINERAGTTRRKFAMETRAQQFGMHWCKTLWSTPFGHPDPAHNPPTPAELGDPDPELTEILLQTRLHPDSAQLHQQLGKLYDDRRQYGQALAAFQHSLSLSLTDPWTNLYVGNRMYSMGNYAEALGYFRQAAKTMPHRAVVWWCLGDAYRRLGDIALALRHYTKARDVEPKDKTAINRLREFQNSHSP